MQQLIRILIICSISKAINGGSQRLSVVDWNNYNIQEPEGRGTYAFGYDIEDAETNNLQFRNEARHANGTVTGSYGYLDPDGVVRMVHYIADHLGYRATIENVRRNGQLKPLILPDANSPLAVQAASSENYGKIVTPSNGNTMQSNNNNYYQGQNQNYQPVWPNFSPSYLFNNNVGANSNYPNYYKLF